MRAVFEYTRDTIGAFGQAGVLPEMVRGGNEISPGMFWPDGRLPEQWPNFAGLVKAAIRGVKGELLRSEQMRAGSQQWAPAAEGA